MKGIDGALAAFERPKAAAVTASNRSATPPPVVPASAAAAPARETKDAPAPAAAKSNADTERYSSTAGVIRGVTRTAMPDGVRITIEADREVPFRQEQLDNPRRLFSQLPDWLDASGIHVSEVSSADESLQTLFDSLMKIHRGEL